MPDLIKAKPPTVVAKRRLSASPKRGSKKEALLLKKSADLS